MTAYRVMLKGEKFMLHLDGQDMLCGFIKNEYVWASSEEQAIEKARRRVLIEFAKINSIRPISDMMFSVEPDEIEKDVAIWKLASNEGFIYYPINTSVE